MARFLAQFLVSGGLSWVLPTEFQVSSPREQEETTRAWVTFVELLARRGEETGLNHVLPLWTHN